MADSEEDWRLNCKTLNQAWVKASAKNIFTDVKFVVGSTAVEVPAHKIFFILSSPVFESMLSRSEVDEPVVIPDIEADIFQHFLRSTYGAEVEFSTHVEAAKTYLIADKYKMIHLKQKAEEHMKTAYMDPDAFWSAMLSEHLLNVSALRRRCMDYFAEYAEKLTIYERFKDLPFHAVMSLLEHRDLKIEEIILMWTVGDWASVTNKTYSVEVMKPLSKRFLYQKLTLTDFFNFINMYPNVIDVEDSLAIAMHLHDREKYKLPYWCYANPRMETKTEKRF